MGFHLGSPATVRGQPRLQVRSPRGSGYTASELFLPDEVVPTARLWAVPRLSPDLDICGETKFSNYCNQSPPCGELACRRAINDPAFEHVIPARNQSQILSNGPVLVPPSIGQHDESRLPVTPTRLNLSRRLRHRASSERPYLIG